ncbi:hypothetical protein [Collimonas sp.]|uniref:hypothetical protein n=1 Tax=Collimonas sp. TaxID=1963772 RepID=UPI002B593DB0|nr:hypothetical protein [Collimonas sp.]HWX02618.1 hypothetical protein [Collimonas sp.]
MSNNLPINVKDYGAACDGVTDDSTPLLNANAAATHNKAPLLIPGTMKIGTATTITAFLVDTLAQLFTTSSIVTISNGQPLRPEWWGADPTNTNDSLAAWTACTTSPQCVTILMSGVYSFSNTLTITNAKGLIIKGGGASLIDRQALSYNKFSLNFNNIPSGASGLVINGFRGLALQDFFVSHMTIGTAGGTAIYVNSGDDFEISNIKVESSTGVFGKGIVLGGGTDETCAFMGNIKNCKIYTAGGPAFESNSRNTSLTFQSCYQIGGSFNFVGTIYSSVISCASEYATLYGYTINKCGNMSFIGCGGEANGRGVFYMQSSSYNLVFTNPMGASNNSSGTTGIGDLFQIDSSVGVNQSISIINPTSLYPHANTTYNIAATTGTLYVDVNGVSASQLPRSIGGDSTWKLNYLTFTGYGENIGFTPVLNANWTFVGSPTISGTYVKKGGLITFSINISGTTSVSANVGAQITLPWQESTAPYAAIIMDGYNNNCGFATVNGKTIYVPAIAANSYGLILSGQVTI